jgi:hypothetical protein
VHTTENYVENILNFTVFRWFTVSSSKLKIMIFILYKNVNLIILQNKVYQFINMRPFDRISGNYKLNIFEFINFIWNCVRNNLYIRKVKVKVKLSLCFLTKHNAMKAYWGVKVLLLSFFDLGTRWR